jgi:AhpD family alkylhydroperoxidase
MDARLNLFGNPVAAKFLKYINSAGQVVSGSTLPAATQELVKLRASQINGCGFCTDMHTKDAAHAGSPRRG